MNEQPAVGVESLTFSYGQTPVLDHVSFSVRPGELTALVGPNGSGKSTLIRLILGLLAPSSGSVWLFGGPPSSVKQRWRIGYVPQRAILDQRLPATVEEVVATGRLSRRGWHRRFDSSDHEAVVRAIDAVGLTDRRSHRVQQLSGGQQQRVLIARALASDPDLLILDEPTTGVDAESQLAFRDTLVAYRNRGAAVLLVSHELSAVADDLNRVIVLRGGAIEFDGAPADLVASGVSLGVHAADLPVWLEGKHP